MLNKILNYLKIKINFFKFNSIKFKKIGKNVHVSCNFKFIHPKNITIGDNVYIGPFSEISAFGNVTISDGVIIGPHLTIYSANHNYSGKIKTIPYDSKIIIKDVFISCNVWVGGNVLLLPGVILGEGSIIGAGSVVTKDVPPFAIMGGNPAKILKYRDNIDEYFSLKKLGKIYMKNKNNI